MIVIIIKFCRDFFIIIPGLEKWEINHKAPSDAKWSKWDPHKFNEWRKMASKIKKNWQEIPKSDWKIAIVKWFQTSFHH